jgi:acyl carrier protein
MTQQHGMAVTDPNEQLELIRRIVAEELEIDPSEIEDSSSFVDGYGADSLSLIQVFARIERELHVSVPQEEMNNMVDIQATQAIVARYAGESVDA